MDKLIIEWKHLDVDGETCERCSDTGENIVKAINSIESDLDNSNLDIQFIETALNDNEIKESNLILINNIKIEDIIDIKIFDNYCDSCSSLLGKETVCRAVNYNGYSYEEIPIDAIKEAIYKTLGIENKDLWQRSILSKTRTNCSNDSCC